MAEDDQQYSTIRDPDLLGELIGQRVVDITQQDADEFQEDGEAYVMLHFENGVSVKFRITDVGFDIENP